MDGAEVGVFKEMDKEGTLHLQAWRLWLAIGVS